MNPEDGRRSPEREIIQCCSAAVLLSERWKAKVKAKVERVEAEGKKSKVKWRNLWESGKTSSERELKIFSCSFANEGTLTGAPFSELNLRMSEKIFLSGEERVFSRLLREKSEARKISNG